MMKTLILGLAAAATVAAALPAAAQTVNAREHRQAERIHEGVHSGALSPREALAVHRREARLHRYVARARFHNGGHLTRHQRHVANRIANRDSRTIYRLKHNQRVG